MGFLVSKRSMFGGNSGFVVPDYRVRSVSGYPVVLKKPLDVRRIVVYGNEGGVGDSDLPTGYTRLEYVESTGTQYIDTGVLASDALDIYVEFKTGSNQITLGAFRVVKSIGDVRCHISIDPSKATYGWGKNYLDTSCVLDNNRHILNMNREGFSIDGERVYTPTDHVFAASPRMYLFARNFYDERNSTQTVNYSCYAIYACKIYNNGILVRDFVPAKRNSDNAVGLYDAANDIFYESATSDSLNAGPDIYKMCIISGETKIGDVYSVCQLNTPEEHILLDITKKVSKLITPEEETDISAYQNWSQEFSLPEEDEVIITTDTTIAPSSIEIKYKGKRR